MKLYSRQTVQHKVNQLVHDAPTPCDNETPVAIAGKCILLGKLFDWSNLATESVKFALCHSVSREKICSSIHSINMGKGIGYAPDDDFLRNFFDAAEVAETSTSKICQIYMVKHLLWMRRYTEINKLFDSEDVLSRVTDVVLYCVLAMACEQRKCPETIDFAESL